MAIISMNYLVHNEQDIIEANIRYHASIGVDRFIVMDNGSTDDTRKIVKKLAHTYPITIMDSPQQAYKQSEWKTAMARESHRQGARWSIANDADEFWLPTHGTIQSHLRCIGSTYVCKRYNMLVTKDVFQSQQQWVNTPYIVKRPIALQSQDILSDECISIMLHNIHGKVIVHNFGLVRVHGGNHRASHLGNPWLKKSAENIVVLHYPLRSKKTWLATVQRRKNLLHNGSPKMGNHYRRWVQKITDPSALAKEIAHLTPSCDHMQTLMYFGVVDTIANMLPRYHAAYAHWQSVVRSYTDLQ